MHSGNEIRRRIPSIFLEDYCLRVRMLLNGTKSYNIPESLLWMRAGSDMYKRRAGCRYAKGACQLFRYMKDRGMISTGSYLKSCILRTGSALAPNWLRQFMYGKMLRRKVS